MLDIVKEQGFLAKIYAKGSQENLIKFLEFSSILQNYDRFHKGNVKIRSVLYSLLIFFK